MKLEEARVASWLLLSLSLGTGELDSLLGGVCSHTLAGTCDSDCRAKETATVSLVIRARKCRSCQTLTSPVRVIGCLE